MPDPVSKGSFLNTLAKVVLEVLKGLDNQLLRVAVAAATILAIVAVIDPAGGRFYAALLSGLVFALCLVWALMAMNRRDQDEGNRLRLRSRARAEGLRMRTAKGTNDAVIGRRGEVRGNIIMDAGPSRRSDDTPNPPIAGTRGRGAE
jgi:hypothetical protein